LTPLQESDLAAAEQQLAALSNQLSEPDEQLELLFAACDKLRMAAQECSNSASAAESGAVAVAQQVLGQFATDYRRVFTWVQRVNAGLSSKEAAVKALRSLIQHVMQQQQQQQQQQQAGASSACAAAAAVSPGAAAASASAPDEQN
jgi:serine phosphatase RsbU (regulator of sigma subunit)